MNPRIQPILLDSNAYFRLALSIHPLLQVCFGEDTQFSLFVLPELDDEYRTSVRLRHKFMWVAEQQYVQELLKVMVSAGRIDMDKVTEVLEYLEEDNDLPMPKDRLRRVFKEYFPTGTCPL